uniref:Uncharacterized protein n=1 Tax=Arundo donax TaxID=35708 RepID=A0A0A9H8E7_ARUDO
MLVGNLVSRCTHIESSLLTTLCSCLSFVIRGYCGLIKPCFAQFVAK